MGNQVDDHREKIIGDRYNSIVFGAGDDSQVYVVGGYTRDLLSKRNSLDRDYVVGGSIDHLVGHVLGATGGRLIRLGRQGLQRIVLKKGLTLDFTPLKGDIESDLSSRDFTVNAIAWSPDSGWVDPKGGICDLDRRIIRMITARNLISDPLRILRAYRLAAELDFEIEPETRTALKEESSLIGKVKSERITSEFFKILNQNRAPRAVEMLLHGGLLSCLITSSYEDLERKLEVLDGIYRRSFAPALKYGISFDKIFSQALRHIGFLGLAVLLEGLPDNLFSLSSRVIKRLSRINRAREILETAGTPLNREKLFEVFEAGLDAIPDLLFIRDLQAYREEFEEYKRIQRDGLAGRVEVRSVLEAVSSGRALGHALRDLRKAEFIGYVRSAEEAEGFVRRLIIQSDFT